MKTILLICLCAHVALADDAGVITDGGTTVHDAAIWPDAAVTSDGGTPIDAAVATCGNGLLEDQEACDDGPGTTRACPTNESCAALANCLVGTACKFYCKPCEGDDDDGEGCSAGGHRGAPWLCALALAFVIVVIRRRPA